MHIDPDIQVCYAQPITCLLHSYSAFAVVNRNLAGKSFTLNIDDFIVFFCFLQNAAVEALPSFFSEYYTSADGVAIAEARGLCELKW